ncbi:uncharacterized protein PG986_010675 [Apiospora aurea]|uniref:BTB domain-containing protein n=1 Tax=Apiospora aurea TaxID=335848 RepID=A0ABR1Q2X6_9PEZI
MASTSKFDSVEEYLKSGHMSDVKVTCGSRTWNLHKIILCRSPFFEKAFTGDFKEAHQNQMTLHDTEPQDVHGVIFYLYTGIISSDLEKDNSIQAYIQMFELGDFFDIKDLRQHAVKRLTIKLADVARSVIDLVIRGNSHSGVPAEQFNDFSRLAQVAYSTDSQTYEPLRQLFLVFFARLP